MRKVVKEQVESLGAKFVEVDVDEDAQTAGGYAKEVSEEYKQKQAREAIATHVAKADVVHHHRAHPRQARADPRHREMVEAHERRLGHRRPRRRAGRQLRAHRARPDGRRTTASPSSARRNLPSDARRARQPDVVAQHGEAASSTSRKDGTLKLDSSDEIVRGCSITHERRDRRCASSGGAVGAVAPND